MQLRHLVLILAVPGAACAPKGTSQPAPQPSFPTSSAQKPAVPPKPIEPTKPVEPTPSKPEPSAKLQLRLAAATVVNGGKVELFAENVGATDFVFHHPGASNGCGRFRWIIDLVHDGGVHYSNDHSGPGMACTMAIIPPSDITVPAGGNAKLVIDTGRDWYVVNVKGGRPTMRPAAARLEIGNYRVIVRGVGVPLTTTLTVQ